MPRFFTIPEGPAGALTVEAGLFRTAVRSAAERWCDNPKTLGPDVEACGKCQACEARGLILAGAA